VDFQNADQYYHVLEYGGLGLLLVRAMRVSARTRWPLYAALMALSLGTAIGAADETFQSFVPGRDSSIWDVLADVSGLVAAQLFYLFLVRE
jgi:VanZ family protein